MEKKQTGLLIKQIDSLYPGRLSLTPETVDTWHRVLQEQDYDKTVNQLVQYAKDNRFPPTVSDLVIRKYEAYESNILEQIRKWESEASGKR